MDDHAYPLNPQAVGAMRCLIRHYLRRQVLVAVAMFTVHPAPLQTNGERFLGLAVRPYVSAWQRRTAGNPRWQAGLWRAEWRYWAHGLGCRLVHQHTGEPLEWDAPELLSFDERWFWTHLEWRIGQTSKPDKVAAHTLWLQRIFYHMLISGQLVRADNGKLRLRE